MELFDCLPTMRGHTPDVCKVGILMEKHGKCVGIKLRESVAQSCDQGANRLLIASWPRRIGHAGER